MRIGQLAAKTGVSVRALRYYEEHGLLSSTRSAGGQRHYTEDGVDRVNLIQQLFTAGLSSRTIADLLPHLEAPGPDSAEAVLARVAQERGRLSHRITELSRARDTLDAAVAGCTAELKRPQEA